MKKTLLALLSSVLLITVTQPAQAEDQKVLAIIDTAIDSKNVPSVIYEACFTLNNTCPNKTNFMEGKGSASAVVWAKSVNDSIYHGNAMVKAALAVNPNIKIVFVRFHEVNSSGKSSAQADSLVKAIEWVSNNADKYSIDAVSISQSNIKNPALCTDKTTVNAVLSMSTKNIPTFAATGNDKKSDVVGFPACVEGAIGVGALWTLSELEAATNRGPGLDLVAFGKISITKVNGSQYDLAGSSGATAVSASSYISKNIYKTFQEYLKALPKVVINKVSYSLN